VRSQPTTWIVSGWSLAAFVAVAAAVLDAQASPVFINNIEWIGHGVWLKADLHTHTRFSDGAHSVDEVVREASRNGCDVVAISDHADRTLNAGTPEYVEAIRAARLQYPGITILTALEWNVPPGGGDEHATILFPAATETSELLTSFKERFDDYHRGDDRDGLVSAALSALTTGGPVLPAVIVNHPSRRPASASAPTLTFGSLKRTAPGALVGFEGAPGHQRATPLGAYPPESGLLGRWDPLAATLDGAWDQWLREGTDVWSAIASSDFHNEREDFWPCEFAATWIYAPDRTVDGVLRAIHAGSFFAEHGHIVSEVELQVRVDGSPRPVVPGETIAVRAGDPATVSLHMRVPSLDYRGRDNRVDNVELLGISGTKTAVLFNGPPGHPDAFTTTITVPDGGIVLRARGRRSMVDEPEQMFYTNPIRISAPGR
jgi:hypothetical protein